MRTIRYPAQQEWKALTTRPSDQNDSLRQRVEEILNIVKKEKDKGLAQLTQELHGIKMSSFEITKETIAAAENELPEELKEAILNAKKNIETFHKAQLREEKEVETMPGIRCWRRSVGIEKVGLYIPGGTAPLFSTVLMLGVPATLAGCEEIILCTPPGPDGNIHPAILFTAAITGITRIFRIGGAQAIAAMAYGTETVPQVYKIFGPGNQYVTTAKLLVQLDGVAIDMPAGPSEVCVLADETADPVFIAADLLAQAEHGADSQVMLVTDSEDIIVQTIKEIEKQLVLLPRRSLAEQALQNSRAILVRDIQEGILLVNEYAAEHLIINCRDAELVARSVTNAGSVFIGAYTPESVGDYASGTNHTLPTNGFARAWSGVSTDSFVRKITYQQLSREGLQHIAATVETMAEAEGLQGHATAVRLRRDKL